VYEVDIPVAGMFRYNAGVHCVKLSEHLSVKDAVVGWKVTETIFESLSQFIDALLM
jgi:hypothetical protein